MTRSICAILAGVMAFGVMMSIMNDVMRFLASVSKPSMIDDTLYLFAALCGALAVVMASWLAAWLVATWLMFHALAVGAVCLALGMLHGFSTTAAGPFWHSWALAISALPAAWLGGKLRQASASPEMDEGEPGGAL